MTSTNVSQFPPQKRQIVASSWHLHRSLKVDKLSHWYLAVISPNIQQCKSKRKKEKKKADLE